MKLDHNMFGSEGAIALSEGLAMNSTLRLLSISFCGIGPEAADALFEIMS